MNEIIIKLLKKIETLEQEIKQLRNKDNRPIFHTMSEASSTGNRRIEQLTLTERNTQKEEIDQLLEKATDLAILHYKKNPPRRE